MSRGSSFGVARFVQLHEELQSLISPGPGASYLAKLIETDPYVTGAIACFAGSRRRASPDVAPRRPVPGTSTFPLWLRRQGRLSTFRMAFRHSAGVTASSAPGLQVCCSPRAAVARSRARGHIFPGDRSVGFPRGAGLFSGRHRSQHLPRPPQRSFVHLRGRCLSHSF
jgi:hypothetical protein